MDLLVVLQQLKKEKARIDRAIAELEALRAEGVTGHGKLLRRQGRRSMGPGERQEVALRMKRYWEGRQAPRDVM